MASQLISYDLVQPGRNYSALYEAIKSLGSTWCRCLESVWIVRTDKSSAEVRDRLLPFLDSNDRIAVLSLGGDWATRGIDTKVVDWLKQNV